MSQQQIAWAAYHDWFLYPSICGLGVTVVDRYVFQGEYFEEVLTFTNYKQLRNWAGY